MVLQSIDADNTQEITSCGRILWELVSGEERMREKVVAYCKEEMRRDASNATQSDRAFDTFELVCTPAYDGFLTVLAELLGWDTEESPGIMEFGQERVKGTQEQMPESDKPTTKLQALLDKRPCFTAIRRGFLECCGRNLVDFQQALVTTLTNFMGPLEQILF